MRVEEFEVTKLKPHPLSYEIFGDMDDDDLRDLQEDIKKRGLQRIPEVVENVVISGSQRLRAIRNLGWSVVQVQVRDDLKNEEAIEEHLIKDNTLRRQLTPAQQFQAARKLEEIYSREYKEIRKEVYGTRKDSSSGELESPYEQARDRAAEEVGLSGASYHRLKTIEQSDRDDIKEAVNKGQLSISAGFKALKHRPPEDGEHDDTIKFLQFKRRVEEFERYLVGHPKVRYNGYAPEIDKLLDHTIVVVQDWKSPEVM